MAALALNSEQDVLLPLALEVDKTNLACMALLDKANTETYGDPVPVDVPSEIETGPFIIVTGHDLKDLELLLEQTDGKGVSVYTHGEMLPAHAYPKPKEHPQLKGNFGTAWQNQRKEFDGVPAPILFTTNCLMPPKASYIDRVFTSDCVEYNGTQYIDANKDFSPLITKAIELGGYTEPHQMVGINGGTHATTGFGRATVISIADDAANTVKAGQIGHFFLVGGCDGARPSRNYFTDFVQ